MKSPDRLTILRWLRIFLTVWLLPSYGVMAAMFAMELARTGFSLESLYGLVAWQSWLTPAVIGLILGPPCWIIGFGLWALAHRFGKASPLLAALIGAMAPFPLLAWYLHERWEMDSYLPYARRVAGLVHEIPLVSAVVVIGALTGWLVWRIAYRPSADPRQP